MDQYLALRHSNFLKKIIAYNTVPMQFVLLRQPFFISLVGFVPTNLLEVKPLPDNTIAITCGPVVMIKFVIKNLLELGFSDQQIFTTMENRMKCGIGKCGRCNVGHLYVCKDGPVFSYATLKDLPEF